MGGCVACLVKSHPVHGWEISTRESHRTGCVEARLAMGTTVGFASASVLVLSLVCRVLRLRADCD